MSVITIGDVHGSLQTLKALIKKLPVNEATICMVGDLIDRGNDCSGVIDFVMQNNFDCVLGNHEDLGLDAYKYTHRYGKDIWRSNGGDRCKFTNEQIDWISKLPKAITYEDEVIDGRKLLVTHTMIYDIDSYISNDYLHLWNRHNPIDFKEYFQVFGHTPTQYFDFGELEGSDEPIITDYFAAIDTGCVLQKVAPKEFPKTFLSALQFPEMKIFKQEYIG